MFTLLPKRTIITTSTTQRENNKMTIYNQEALTALYKSLEFMECNDLPCKEIKVAINKIESLLK